MSKVSIINDSAKWHGTGGTISDSIVKEAL